MDVGHEPLDSVGGFEFSTLVAADMQSGSAIELGSKLIALENLDQKLAQFEGSIANVVVFDQRWVVVSHHGDAGSRRANNVVVVVEDLAEPLSHVSSLVEMTGVEVRLPAASLSGGIIDIEAEVLEQAQRGNAGLRIESVDVAGNE